MRATIDNGKIQKCEIEYSKSFSESVEMANFVRYRDALLKDMYYHNFTLIKDSDSDDKLHKLIEDEISLRKAEGEHFCNIVSFVPISDSLLGRFNKFEIKPEVTLNGFYLFDVNKLSELNVKKDCVVSKVTDRKMIEDTLRIESELYNDDWGIDFCTRRTNRRKSVCLSSENLNAYVCYDQNEAVGVCDLFIHDGAAKIEDLSVSAKKQRQGYGTVILKSLIGTALNKGASTIYLVTDEDETAKEMYLKNGFAKIGVKTDLFFKL